MTAKHTPGPWRYSPQHPSGLFGIVYSPDWGRIVSIEAAEGCRGREGARANAHLIAAAPELLAALEGLMAAFGGVTSHAQQRKWDEALAAISKAREEGLT